MLRVGPGIGPLSAIRSVRGHALGATSR